MKTFRIWVYGLVEFWDRILVIKKWRWPFTWCYDLPWWKLEHWEKILECLKRELKEETWLDENDFVVEKFLSVEEDFIKHIWKLEEKEEQIIAIIYLVKIIKDDFNLDYLEEWGDSVGLKLIKKDDFSLKMTNVLKKILGKKSPHPTSP